MHGVVQRGSPTTGRVNSSPITPRRRDETKKKSQRKVSPLKEGYNPIINLVTPESSPANRNKNLAADDCASPPPPSILLNSSKGTRRVKKKSVRFDFDCNLEAVSSRNKRKKSNDKEEVDSSPNSGDVIASQDGMILDRERYTITEYQPQMEHGTRDTNIAANSNRNNDDNGKDGTTDNIDMTSTTITTDGNVNNSNRNNNDERDDTLIATTTTDGNVNEECNDDVMYSDFDVALTYNDGDDSNVDDAGDDADDDDVADFNVDFDSDGVATGFTYATPGNCDVMVDSGEREDDRLDDISIANDDDDGIESIRRDFVAPSLLTDPSLDGAGSGSGSGSGSSLAASIESNLTIVGRYNGREYTRGEIEESGYCTWVCFLSPFIFYTICI